MTLFTASDARRRFGRLLETVQREPVTITKSGRAAAIMLSASDNELIAAVEGFLRIANGVRGSLRLSAGAISAPGRVNAY
jgi:prevent-host-death family protein